MQLVRRNPYATIGRAVYLSRRAQLGIQLAKVGWANRKAIYRMGRGALKRARVYRRSRAQRAYKKRRISGDPQRGPSNQSFYGSTGIPTSQNTFSIPRKTLWKGQVQLAKPPDAAETLGKSSTEGFRLKGVKVCVNAINNATTAAGIYTVHIALVQHKSNVNAVNFPAQEFFVNPGGGDVGTIRYLDFNDVGTAPQVEQQYNCNGINKERWNIVTHVKRRMGVGALNGSGPMSLKFEKYYDFGKKRFTFDNVSDGFVSRPFWLLIWYERLADNSPAAPLDIAFNVNTVTYFKNS